MTDEYKKQLGKRLEKIRKAKGFSSLEVAKQLGLKSNTFRNYERGLREISIGTILFFAKLMNVSLDYLFYGEDSNEILYEWMYKFEHTKWEINPALMTEKEAKEFFEKINTKPEYKKTGREFFM